MKTAAATILVLILAIVLVAYLSIDLLVKRGIERGASDAAGVPASVQSVRLGLLSGDLTLNTLELENPSGFELPFFFRLDRLQVAVHPRSLLGAPVRVPQLTLEGIRLNLERAGRASNFDAILAHMRRDGGQPAPSAEERRFIIDELRIADVGAQVVFARELGERGTAQLALSPIVMRNIGAESGGVTISELAHLVLREVFEQAKQSGKLPPELQQRLTSALAQVQGVEERLRERKGQAEQQAREQAGQAQEQAREQTERAIRERREQLQEEAQKLLEGR